MGSDNCRPHANRGGHVDIIEEVAPDDQTDPAARTIAAVILDPPSAVESVRRHRPSIKSSHGLLARTERRITASVA